MGLPKPAEMTGRSLIRAAARTEASQRRAGA
jgi:hypothetical protein